MREDYNKRAMLLGVWSCEGASAWPMAVDGKCPAVRGEGGVKGLQARRQLDNNGESLGLVVLTKLG